MSRNGSGTYSLPSPPTPFVNGTTANAPDVNTVLNDIATAMTDSVAADGQTPMTGALNMNNQNITGANALTVKTITLNSSAMPLLLRGLINGLTLSNDAVSPNLILDIAAGTCVDSTNASFITLGAFTKSIGGSWTAGSGSNGMGQGLTATASTWYHVFAIINSGTPDIYFDTSVTAANAPANTTAFRRIGSIKLDASVHILGFTQLGDLFNWNVPTLDINAGTPASGVATPVTLTVPPGVRAVANMTASAGYVSGTATSLFIYSPSVTTAPLIPVVISAVAGNSVCDAIQALTNTLSQVVIKLVFSGSTTFSLETTGWYDNRGRG